MISELNDNSKLSEYINGAFKGVMLSCTSCNKRYNSGSSFSLIGCPDVICFSLGRNVFGSKCFKKVLPDKSITLECHQENIVFDISRSIIAHLGSNVNGHYITYSFDNNNIVEYNDKNVSLTSWQNIKELVLQNSHVFFYKRHINKDLPVKQPSEQMHTQLTQPDSFEKESTTIFRNSLSSESDCSETENMKVCKNNQKA